MRILVAGWFSFEEMGATAGDLLARDLTCRWLEQAGCSYDVAVALPFTGGIDWRVVDPARYSHVVFVCGPFGNGPPLVEFLQRFQGRILVGLDLTLLEPLEVWNPFALLWERDSSRQARPDISFLGERPHVPVVGLVLIHPQPEYRERDRHREANEALCWLVGSREAAAVHIDTRLDVNSTGLRTAVEVESLVARMDVVLTTRLHGMVLALKNSVPAVVIDPVAGGAKIKRQAECVGWPIVFTPENVSQGAMERAFDYCLSAGARTQARDCRDQAIKMAERTRDEFIAALTARVG
jgi:Polysaccharide pyruvyl transferase